MPVAGVKCVKMRNVEHIVKLYFTFLKLQHSSYFGSSAPYYPKNQDLEEIETVKRKCLFRGQNYRKLLTTEKAFFEVAVMFSNGRL